MISATAIPIQRVSAVGAPSRTCTPLSSKCVAGPSRAAWPRRARATLRASSRSPGRSALFSIPASLQRSNHEERTCIQVDCSRNMSTTQKTTAGFSRVAGPSLHTRSCKWKWIGPCDAKARPRSAGIRHNALSLAARSRVPSAETDSMASQASRTAPATLHAAVALVSASLRSTDPPKSHAPAHAASPSLHCKHVTQRPAAMRAASPRRANCASKSSARSPSVPSVATPSWCFECQAFNNAATSAPAYLSSQSPKRTPPRSSLPGLPQRGARWSAKLHNQRVHRTSASAWRSPPPHPCTSRATVVSSAPASSHKQQSESNVARATAARGFACAARMPARYPPRAKVAQAARRVTAALKTRLTARRTSSRTSSRTTTPRIARNKPTRASKPASHTRRSQHTASEVRPASHAAATLTLMASCKASMETWAPGEAAA
mmetsp:Transcript_25945/g.72392  ORF Transcript_25945/g.72392 Transcript_25945/m.72392 type:complete len:434 (-) Transcript_25945:182-1483(-)